MLTGFVTIVCSFEARGLIGFETIAFIVKPVLCPLFVIFCVYNPFKGVKENGEVKPKMSERNKAAACTKSVLKNYVKPV